MTPFVHLSPIVRIGEVGSDSLSRCFRICSHCLPEARKEYKLAVVVVVVVVVRVALLPATIELQRNIITSP
jgi:hypothetical protein